MIRRLRSHNATAASALDVLCARETIREIFDAMTIQQFVVAALLFDGMATAHIADALNITPAAVSHRRKQAQDRVARTMPHVNAEHLLGDVLARKWQPKRERDNEREAGGTCSVCGRSVHYRKAKCKWCAQRERRERERGEAT